MSTKTRNFKQTASRVGVCYFVLMLITQGVQLVASIFLMDQLAAGGIWVWLISMAPLYCIAMPIFLWMMHVLVPGRAENFGTAPLKTVDGLRWLVLCLGLTYICNFVSILITALLGMIKGGAVVNPLESLTQSGSPLMTLLFACILAPVGEEFLFRKVLYDKVGRFGTRTYVLLSGFIFAMFHANLSQLLYAFVLGCAFSYIYAHTGRLIHTIALHILVNTVGSLALPLLVAGGGDAGAIAGGLCVIVLAVAGIVIAVRKRWRFAPQTAAQEAPQELTAEIAYGVPGEPEQERPAKKDVPPTFGGAMRTAGMIAYTLLCVALIAVVTFMM